ncbi:MAG: thiamine pyrophosphate-dependent enzyme [Candidatus Woesearchaeota archaeon]
MNLKELTKNPERISSGHRMCPGCIAPVVARMVLKATNNPVVVASATGCLEVSTTIYPYTSWKVPFIHNAFENCAATISGIETAFRVLKRQGKITKDIKFLAFGGDGGTYDIGLQSLSGALERGHDFVYVCYDNEAYMNTGIQRSSATPFGASTKTAPAGKMHLGKEEFKKDLMGIVTAHKIPYVAQASIHNWNDLLTKAKKAFETKGPSFLNILSPCVPGWGISMDCGVSISKIAVETCFWPLYEVINDEYKLNFDPNDKKLPIEEWLKPQMRFKHLFRPENKHLIEKIQNQVNKDWENLKKRCSNS